MTFYDILGVTRDASLEEIRAAYRALAKQHHPDLLRQAETRSQKLAEERIKAINEAYDTLRDPEKRRAYHLVMWTSRDPARKYGHLFTPSRPPSRSRNAQNKQQKRADEKVAHAFLRLQTLRSELDFLRHRQQVKRGRFWFGTAFSTLIVFSIMWMENVSLSTTDYSLFTRLLVFIFTFLSCELIAIPIVINASGMKFPQHPLLSNPVVFSLSIFAGTSLSCVSIIGPRTFNPALAVSLLTGGIVLSAALLVHMFISYRLAHIHDRLFRAEEQQLKDEIMKLEARLGQMRSRHRP